MKHETGITKNKPRFSAYRKDNINKKTSAIVLFSFTINVFVFSYICTMILVNVSASRRCFRAT